MMGDPVCSDPWFGAYHQGGGVRHPPERRARSRASVSASRVEDRARLEQCRHATQAGLRHRYRQSCRGVTSGILFFKLVLRRCDALGASSSERRAANQPFGGNDHRRERHRTEDTECLISLRSFGPASFGPRSVDVLVRRLPAKCGCPRSAIAWGFETNTGSRPCGILVNGSNAPRAAGCRSRRRRRGRGRDGIKANARPRSRSRRFGRTDRADELGERRSRLGSVRCRTPLERRKQLRQGANRHF